MDQTSAASNLNRIAVLAKLSLRDVKASDALETCKRFLCGRGWTVYTDKREIIVLTDENILFTDVVGILSKNTWSAVLYGPELHKTWQVVFCLDTHFIKEWYSEFNSIYCMYYTVFEFKYPAYVAPKIRCVEIPGKKEHMLLCWINEFKTAVKTKNKSKMFGPYPDFTSHMTTSLTKLYSDGIRELVTELAHAQRVYFATFGVD